MSWQTNAPTQTRQRKLHAPAWYGVRTLLIVSAGWLLLLGGTALLAYHLGQQSMIWACVPWP